MITIYYEHMPNKRRQSGGDLKHICEGTLKLAKNSGSFENEREGVLK